MSDALKTPELPDARRGTHCVQRLVRALTPTYHHQAGYPMQPWRMEYWTGDDRYRASLHLHWNWRGRAHWLCVILPEWPNVELSEPPTKKL